VICDEAHDGLAHLEFCGRCCGLTFARVLGAWGDSKVRAEHVDAGLALFVPVVREAGHGVDAG
jgi:hypothetical protein